MGPYPVWRRPGGGAALGIGQRVIANSAVRCEPRELAPITVVPVLLLLRCCCGGGAPGRASECDFITEVSCSEIELLPQPRTSANPGHVDIDGEEVRACVRRGWRAAWLFIVACDRHSSCDLPPACHRPSNLAAGPCQPPGSPS
jgi:hypothetical protein